MDVGKFELFVPKAFIIKFGGDIDFVLVHVLAHDVIRQPGAYAQAMALADGVENCAVMLA